MVPKIATKTPEQIPVPREITVMRNKMMRIYAGRMCMSFATLLTGSNSMNCSSILLRMGLTVYST